MSLLESSYDENVTQHERSLATADQARGRRLRRRRRIVIGSVPVAVVAAVVPGAVGSLCLVATPGG
jgi:hypothetical protein